MAPLLLLVLAACGTGPGPGDGGSGAIEAEPLDATTKTQTGRFLLQNTSNQDVSYTISTRDNMRSGNDIEQWFTIEPSSGTIAGSGSQVVELRTNEVFSQDGLYRSVIVVDYPGGQTLYDVAAQLPETTTPELSLSESSLTLQRDETSAPITISVSGFSGKVSFTAFRTDDIPGAHIDITALNPTSSPGTTTFRLHPQADAPAGTYEIVIRGEHDGEAASETITVTVPGDGGGGQEGTITGTLRTDNARIPLTPPSGPAAQSLSGQSADNRPAYVPGQVLVKFEDGTLQTLSAKRLDQAALLRDIGGALQLSLQEAGTAQLPAVVRIESGQDPLAVAARLEQDPRVAYAEPNYYLYTQSVPGDPETDQLWNMAISGLPVAWSESDSASSVTVAVIDTGIDVDHPDLSGHIANGGMDFCASANCATTDDDPRPDDPGARHGTHVTGVLAAVGNNGEGVAGVLHGGASIVPIKAFTYSEASGISVTTVDALSKAIRYAAGETVDAKTIPAAAKIINLSVGTTDDAESLRKAIADAANRGALIVASSGNAGTAGVYFPAAYDRVLAVGSVNSKFRRSCFSSYGPELDIMAAGGDGFLTSGTCSTRDDEAVLSTLPGGNYGIEAGTSQATPVVSGVAALLLSQEPGLSATELTNRLKDNAYFDGSYMIAGEYGAGILRADSALGLLGPAAGRNVPVTVSATREGDSDLATPTLDLLLGISGSFTISGLEPGSYSLEADVTRNGRSLAGSDTASTGDDVTIDMAPAP